MQPRAEFGPLRGFGRLWQKTYQVALVGIDATPTEVIAFWKAHFAAFWPPDDHFSTPLTGIRPGEFAEVDLSLPGGGSLSTGVLVLDADAESFTLLTPPDHIFAGWITFSSAYRGNRDRANPPAQERGDTHGEPVQHRTAHARAQVLMRANDPLYELGLTLGGHAREDRFWTHTFTELARALGVPEDAIAVDVRNVCIDRRRQWGRVTNLRHNALLKAPFQAVGHFGRRLHAVQHGRRRRQAARAQLQAQVQVNAQETTHDEAHRQEPS